MARPRSPRKITSQPIVPLFKPGGVRARSQVKLGDDEFEALRLSDLERLQQTDAAARMGISRQTFGRVLLSARRKVAEAIILGRALRIESAVVADDDGQELMRAGRCGADPARCARCGQDLVQLGRRRASATPAPA